MLTFESILAKLKAAGKPVHNRIFTYHTYEGWDKSLMVYNEKKDEMYFDSKAFPFRNSRNLESKRYTPAFNKVFSNYQLNYLTLNPTSGIFDPYNQVINWGDDKEVYCHRSMKLAKLYYVYRNFKLLSISLGFIDGKVFHSLQNTRIFINPTVVIRQTPFPPEKLARELNRLNRKKKLEISLLFKNKGEINYRPPTKGYLDCTHRTMRLSGNPIHCMDECKGDRNYSFLLPQEFISLTGYDTKFLKKYIKAINKMFVDEFEYPKNNLIISIEETKRRINLNEIHSLFTKKTSKLWKITFNTDKAFINYFLLILIRNLWFSSNCHLPSITMRIMEIDKCGMYKALVLSAQLSKNSHNWNYYPEEFNINGFISPSPKIYINNIENNTSNFSFNIVKEERKHTFENYKKLWNKYKLPQ